MPNREPLKLLFICSMNQWRSPTAEKVFSNRAQIETRSRGTSRKARRSVTHSDVAWADLIFVMEDKHRRRLESDFPRQMANKQLFVLDIPDDYQFMDPVLIDEILTAVKPILDPLESEEDNPRTEDAPRS